MTPRLKTTHGGHLISDQTSTYCMPCLNCVPLFYDTSYTSAPKTSGYTGLYMLFTALETMVKYTHTHTHLLYKYIHFKFNCKIVQLSNNYKCHTWETCLAHISEVKWIATFHFSFKKLL